jgi:hypothetical protein
MAKKKSLFKSKAQIKKSAKDDAVQAGISFLAGIGANVGYEQAKKRLPDNYAKFAGPAVALAGGALVVAGANPMLQAAGHGMLGASGTLVLNDLAPDLGMKIGLSGPADASQNPEMSELEREMLAEFLNKQETVETIENDVMPGVDADV